MNIIVVDNWWHTKNYNFLKNIKKINITWISKSSDLDNYNLNEFNAVFFPSPCDTVNIAKYPNTKFIFGPHLMNIPSYVIGNNSYFNLLSRWVANYFMSTNNNYYKNIVYLPFGVDSKLFINDKTLENRHNVIIYFKHRDNNDLNYVLDYLKSKNIDNIVFSYNKRYNEMDFLSKLKNAKYGIIIDAHESQGFAIQEMLSCDVPLLVWNITNMAQEYGSSYRNDVEATTVPYWDNRCGECFYNKEELELTHKKFIDNLNNYRPREFILENLSMEACEDRLINFINTINNK